MLSNKFAGFKGLAFLAVVMVVSLPARASIVVNGGFETGDFSGWTQFGSTSFASVVSDPPVPQSGVYGASFGEFDATGGISQTLATTTGAKYTVDFWLQNEADPFGAFSPNSFAFSWGGVTQLTLANASPFAYKHYSFTLTALAGTTDIRFAFRQDPAFYDLDNVAVTAAVPEPETWALFAVGLAGLVARRRKHRVA
jgi:hypothetical protein